MSMPRGRLVGTGLIGRKKTQKMQMARLRMVAKEHKEFGMMANKKQWMQI
tara:strand:- start:359 stop:508 length:150 start_codon:yes stop_codon:yes gene_type:complete